MKGLIGKVGTNTTILGFLALSQIVFEYLLASWADVADFELYITCRNLLLTIGSVSLLGASDVIVRVAHKNPEKVGRLSRLAFTGVVVATFGTFIFGDFLFEHQDIKFIGLFSLCLFLFSLAQIVSSFYRATHQFNTAMFFRDGWRSALWLSPLFVGILGGYSLWVVAALIVFYVILIFIVLIKNNYLMQHIQTAETCILDKSDFRFCLSFWISALSLVVASYFDQLFLGYMAGTSGQLKQYSLGVLFVVTPFLLISTSLGYILMPTIAAHGDKRNINTKMKLAIKYRPLLMLCVAGFGYFYYYALNFVLAYVDVSIDWILFLLLYLIGVIRLLYAVPSSLLGAVASHRQLDFITGFGVAVMILQVVITYFMYLAIDVAGIALATLLMWILRCGAGLYLSLVIIRGKI